MWFRNEIKEQVTEQVKSRIPKSNTKYDQVVMLTRIDQFNFEVPPGGQIVYTVFTPTPDTRGSSNGCGCQEAAKAIRRLQRTHP